MTAREQRLANVAAIATRRRAQTRCRHGHPLTKRRCGRRECLTCKRDQHDRWYQLAVVQLSVDPDDPRHGTTTGYYLRCRCVPCLRARNDWKARHRARRAVAA